MWFHKIPVLKSVNNACIWFDHEKGLCKHYEKRPLECRLYPVTLNEYGNIAINKCPGIKNLTEEELDKVKEIAKKIFSLDKKFYSSLKILK